MKTTKKSFSAIALAAVLLAGGLWWWHGHQAPAAVVAKTGGGPVPVTLFTALRQDVPVTVQVNGNVASLNSVDVRPQVSNLVQKVNVKEGQFVRAGELLFTLDDRADRANLDKARAQQQKDQASLADLERQYQRSLDLVAQSFIAQSAADTSLSAVQAQRAAVAADVAAVQASQVALTYDSLRAPIAGRIGAINVYPGSLAQPTAALVTVTQLDPISVSFPVPEGSLQDLLQAAKIRGPVLARVPGAAAPLKGVLSFVDNTVDPTIGTVRAKAVFDNATQQLWPGQYVAVDATVRTLSGATVVPLAAVITNTTGKLVYVVAQDNTVQARPITLDYSFGERGAVRGVEPGDQVVVDGKQNLRPGSKVRVEAARRQAPADGTGAAASEGPQP